MLAPAGHGCAQHESRIHVWDGEINRNQQKSTEINRNQQKVAPVKPPGEHIRTWSPQNQSFFKGRMASFSVF